MLYPDNDCYNAPLITEHLNGQLKFSKSFFESESSYDDKRNAVKKKKWAIQFKCNPIVDDNGVLHPRPGDNGSRRVQNRLSQ